MLLIAALLLTACSQPPAAPRPAPDETKLPWYGKSVDELAALDRDASQAFAAGNRDQAAALIEKGEPMMNRLLAVPRPTLAATEAASDLDELYGRMLLTNRHYGWARLQFQKNLARWKHWQPQTPETARRLALAQSQIAECDTHLPK